MGCGGSSPAQVEAGVPTSGGTEPEVINHEPVEVKSLDELEVMRILGAGGYGSVTLVKQKTSDRVFGQWLYAPSKRRQLPSTRGRAPCTRGPLSRGHYT